MRRDDAGRAERTVEEFDDISVAPPGAQQCSECTILIGSGYLETEPYVHPTRPGVVCWRCFESLERRAQRPPAPEGRGPAPRRPLPRSWGWR
jgi:hypothetical protein